MKLTIESTSRIVTLDGLPARIWEGKTESGIGVICFVSRVAVKENEDTSQFEKELAEQRAPSAEAGSFPLRMVL